MGFHLLAVVNDMLNMSRLDAGDFQVTVEPFKIGAAIASCRDLLALKAQEAGIALCGEASAALPDIVADKRAVKQILINLISNAIKFTDRGGTVKMAAKLDRPHILISVEDTGIGIAPDDLDRIGNPFYQARGNYARRRDGAGLGLSIVKGLVRLHRGDLEIRSTLGKGTCVTVRLPLDCEGAAAATASADREDPPCRCGLAMLEADELPRGFACPHGACRRLGPRAVFARCFAIALRNKRDALAALAARGSDCGDSRQRSFSAGRAASGADLRGPAADLGEATGAIAQLPRPRPAAAAAAAAVAVGGVASRDSPRGDGIPLPRARRQAPPPGARADPIADLLDPARKVSALQRVLNDFGYGPIKVTAP